jgi:hypothetical protein
MLNANDPAIQVRRRTTANNKSGLIIAINTSPKFVQTVLHLRSANDLVTPFEGRTIQAPPKAELTERFPPYGVHVYTWGPEPNVILAREQH